MKETVRLRTCIASSGMRLDALEQLDSLGKFPNALPHFRQRERHRLANRFLLIESTILAVHAHIPGHGQLVFVDRMAVGIHLYPLLEKGGAVFQCFKRTATKGIASTVALPVQRELLCHLLAALVGIRRLRMIEAQ